MHETVIDVFYSEVYFFGNFIPYVLSNTDTEKVFVDYNFILPW